MDFINHPQALKLATSIVARMSCNGTPCVSSHVRMNGDLMEWLMDNGDVIEVERVVSYRTGERIPLHIMVRHHTESPNGTTFDTIMEKKFNILLDK